MLCTLGFQLRSHKASRSGFILLGTVDRCVSSASVCLLLASLAFLVWRESASALDSSIQDFASSLIIHNRVDSP